MSNKIRATFTNGAQMTMKLSESSPLSKLQDDEILTAIFDTSNQWNDAMVEMIQTTHEYVFGRELSHFSNDDIIEIDGRGYIFDRTGFSPLETE